MPRTVILCPFYNDEGSFKVFLPSLEHAVLGIDNQAFHLLIVNDGSPTLRFNSKIPHTIIQLHRNIGHQKAIALGLAYAHGNLSFDQVVVMDCDGEDKPEDIISLLRSSESNETLTVAKRASRQAGQGFQLFYWLYKLLFFVLTGKRISFGNFMCIPRPEVDKLVYFSEIWNHLAGAVLKSKFPVSYLGLHRGRRYEGYSKMSFTSLTLHGLGAIGVFIEVVAVRLLQLSLVTIAISIIAILVVLFIKVFTNRAIPGWTTTAISAMLVILLQSLLLSLFTIFLYLSFKGQRQFIPAHHYMDYVRSVETEKHG